MSAKSPRVLLVLLPRERMLAARCLLEQSYSFGLDGLIDFCRAVQIELQAEWQAYEAALPPGFNCDQLLAAARIQYQSENWP